MQLLRKTDKNIQTIINKNLRVLSIIGQESINCGELYDHTDDKYNNSNEFHSTVEMVLNHAKDYKENIYKLREDLYVEGLGSNRVRFISTKEILTAYIEEEQERYTLQLAKGFIENQAPEYTLAAFKNLLK